jgi:hypothetical protein
MRIWRGGSLGSGPVGGGRGQAARWRARSGSAGRRGRRQATASGGATQVAAMVAGRRCARARAVRDRAVAADAGGGGRRWAGSAARFGCEWAGRAWE